MEAEKSILERIVEKRRQDIAQKGWTLGESVPEKRRRPSPLPFIAEKGAVLEIKRASPSKGDIAPGLDAGDTAREYVTAGAAAISVLTECHWFKGALSDLQAAAAAADQAADAAGRPRAAILRKDFLLAPEEVDIAYRCGADAVLLIARILESGLLSAMVARCKKLGMTAFIELRQKDDLDKLAKAVEASGREKIVCGVNARDLADFSIDLLKPAMLLKEIRSLLGLEARVVFESGIRTPRAARFAGSLGFTGMLLGEAAARAPEEASALVAAFTGARETGQSRLWLRYAERLQAKRQEEASAGGSRRPPLVKICGLTRPQDALTASELGADLLGFIFWEGSPRQAEETAVREAARAVKEAFAGRADRAPFLVAVAVDLESPAGKRALALVEEGIVDLLQLHGEKALAQFFSPEQAEKREALPHYAVVNIAEEGDLARLEQLRLQGECRILLDAKAGQLPGGSGKRIESSLVEKAARKSRLWLAGGITPENAAAVADALQPELLDLSSGVEAAPGIKDREKLAALFKALGR